MRGALHEAFLQVDSEILTRCRAEDGRDGTTAVAMLCIGQRRLSALVRCYWGHALPLYWDVGKALDAFVLRPAQLCFDSSLCFGKLCDGQPYSMHWLQQ